MQLTKVQAFPRQF